MSERLQYQLATYVNRRLYEDDDEADVARVEAIQEFLETGETNVPGVKIVARWRNPDRRNRNRARWKTTEERGQSLYEFWNTLHGSRGALRKLAERYGL